MAAGMYALTLEKFFLDTMGMSMESETLVKVMLAQSAYTANFSTHNFRDDVTPEPGNSGTYSSGGTVETSTEWAIDDPASGQMSYDAADLSWTGTTITARYAVGYHVTGGAASTDPIIWQSDFGGDVATSGGTFSITWHATNKIIYIDYTP
jgi:hypothetical protein